jgi:hypothetical protein
MSGDNFDVRALRDRIRALEAAVNKLRSVMFLSDNQPGDAMLELIALVPTPDPPMTVSNDQTIIGPQTLQRSAKVADPSGTVNEGAIPSGPAFDLETKGEPPTWEDLRGAAPDATGSLSSEAFVRQSRNEWGKETICELCEGSGESGVTHHDGTQYSTSTPPCPDCGGSGKKETKGEQG